MGWLVAPGVVAVLVGLAAGRLQPHLHPAMATVAFTSAAALAATAIAGVVVVLGVLAVMQLPVIADNIAWCRMIAAEHSVPTWFGAGLFVSALAMVVNLYRQRPCRLSVPDETAELVVLPSDDPQAFAVPGRPGHIVVSSGLLRRLDEDERRVLLAHERAHLRRGHHRYLAVVNAAAAVLPLLGPLRTRVWFATERWADEDAVASVGDRDLVARAICRAALAGRPQAAMALAEFGVAARVDALLQPDGVEVRRASTLSVLTALAVVALSLSWQLHHLAAFAGHVCGIR